MSYLVIAHKKTCDTAGNCKIKKLENNFSSSVKESIINSARLIKIEDTKKNEYKVYIRQRDLIYFISITRSLFKKITYQIEYTRLKRLHPELKKKLEIQYAELHHYQDMMFFMH